jgi:hypothetical protein
MTVYSGTFYHTLKNTLDSIIKDKTDGLEAKLDYKKYCKTPSMSDAYEDDLEVAGPGLASEKPEGTEIATGTLREGTLTRYTARTFGLKIILTEELAEDSKYPEAIKAARHLKRAMHKTIDIDAALMLVRAENTGYTGGDGLCLANSAHTLANGGTFSNTMATPMSPSRAAVIVARAAIRTLPGHDGIREGYTPEKVLCPIEQESAWEGIMLSTKAPEAGNFNEINVVHRMSMELVPVTQWTNTTTNWAIQTDAEGGLQMRMRRKPRASTWREEDFTVVKHAITARWARGWSDPRSFYFVGA